MTGRRVLRKHKLAHIGELRVSDEILRARFASHCSMSKCHGTCCSDGVDLDPTERDKILRNADHVLSVMDERQERDVGRWFTEDFEDSDFPSGRAASTRTHNGACVFLNGQRRCVLQILEMQEPDRGLLKPFYCTAYPICISSSLLTIDDEECAGQFHCCTATEGGNLTIFEICAFELEYVLGREGVDELRSLAETDQL
jgi:hypothetical protein